MDNQQHGNTSAMSESTAPNFTEMNDLAAKRMGGKILFASDDFFAIAENLLNEEEPVWKEGLFTEFGKWMDGWETRRKRITGHDFCIIQLGVSGIIHGFDVDTSYFTGNYAPRVSIQAACLEKEYAARSGDRRGTAAKSKEWEAVAKLDSEHWEEILPLTSMKPGYKATCHNLFSIKSKKRWTHLRLNSYPDGGIARLRVYGQAVPDWTKVNPNQILELSSILNGGICVGYSNAHYGHARNLIKPGRAPNMGDGWETARRLDRPAVLKADDKGILQVPGKEWAMFKLGTQGIIKKIEIDTNHFKGNFPDSTYIECCNKEQGSDWKMLLPPQKLSANTRHFFSTPVKDVGPVTHVRLVMAPDGGISRIRLWGFLHYTVPASRL